MKEEHLLNQEMDALERRFESWSLPGACNQMMSAGGLNHVGGLGQDPTTTHTAPSVPSSRDVTANLPPEVAAFEVDSTSFWFCISHVVACLAITVIIW